MISSSLISGTACFPDGLRLEALASRSFFYGPNGSGKSTLAKLLANPSSYAGASTEMSGVHEVSLYNAEYVQRNFGVAVAGMAGVFLLGEESVAAHDDLIALDANIEELRVQAERLQGTLGDAASGSGKRGELAKARDALQDALWEARGGFPQVLSRVFKGTNNSKAALLERVLATPAHSAVTARALEELIERANVVFDEEAREHVAIDAPPPVTWGTRVADILDEAVKGSDQNRFADMIERLGLIDWVRHGLQYARASDPQCPFCQNNLDAQVRHDLEGYFDARFESAASELSAATRDVSDWILSFQGWVADNRESVVRWVDITTFDLAERAVQDASAATLQALREKQDRWGRHMESPWTGEVMQGVLVAVGEVNDAITAHNAAVRDRNTQEVELIADAWRAYVKIVEPVVAVFRASSRGVESAISSLSSKISENAAKQAEALVQRGAVLARSRSSAPVIDDVNRLLRSTGFNNFELGASVVVPDGYQLIRASGEVVDPETLSEGERTFIAFLYYYHSLRDIGSGGDVPRRIAIIDDPISSLDSDILFVVSTLVRSLLRQIDRNEGFVTQVILLTHNVHFHREVTYVRSGESPAGRSHYMLRKSENGPTSIIPHGSTNPVSTVYRLLWQEVARASTGANASVIGLQNILRRILENYFRVMGQVRDDELIAHFRGEEAVVCRSLLSWVNDGSHSILEELDFSPSNVESSVYLGVFRRVFEYSGHSGHYNMMMSAMGERIEDAELLTV